MQIQKKVQVQKNYNLDSDRGQVSLYVFTKTGNILTR